MKEDDVRLDAQVHELPYTRLKMPEKGWVKACVIPLAVSAFLERVVDRLVVIEVVVLGEDAHAHLVERGGGECLERLLFQFVALVRPRVAGRAEGVVDGAVGVTEVDAIGADGAVVGTRGGRAAEGTGLAGELGAVGASDIRPFADGVGGEADPVCAIAIVEAVDSDDAMAKAEVGGELDVGEGIAGRGAGEFELENVPVFRVDHGSSMSIHNGVARRQCQELTPCVPVSP